MQLFRSRSRSLFVCRPLWLFLFFDLMFFAMAGHAETAAPALPQFQLPATSTTPVIEYNLVQQMLANPDPEPLLRIYGDGRVHVHFPVYMKRAGDYELQLSQVELRALIRTLAADGIIDFDAGAVRNSVRQLEAQRRASSGALFYISDGSVTVIDIALDRYQRNPSARAISGLRKSFAWKNLRHEAGRYPQAQELQRAASAADRLHAFTRRTDLVRIR